MLQKAKLGICFFGLIGGFLRRFLIGGRDVRVPVPVTGENRFLTIPAIEGQNSLKMQNLKLSLSYLWERNYMEAQSDIGNPISQCPICAYGIEET